jgi:hypothetical protein
MTSLALTGERKRSIAALDFENLGKSFAGFIDTAITASSRATFYNDGNELIKAVKHSHQRLMSADRGIYSISLLLPGITDFSRQTAIENLLSNPVKEPGFLTADEETQIIRFLAESLPPQRMLKLYVSLKEGKVNNSRTARIIIASILNSPKLELWSVKYRSKLRESLKHAWGERQSSILAAILQKDENTRNEKELKLVRKYIGKYLYPGCDEQRIHECIRFIFKDESNMTLKKLKAFADAKKSIEAGKVLPYEVLEGIRSTYFPDVKNEEILQLTKSTLTESQKITFQRKAKNSDVKLEFNPEKYDAVRLYLFAYEMGMTEKIRKALDKKALDATFLFNIDDKKAGILVDGSQSMMGPETQKLKPMATALAMRDVLVKAAKESVLIYCGENEIDENDMIVPAGATTLAEGLIEMMMQKPDIIFILSDGYENSPAGRFDEVLKRAKEIGVEIPVIQYSPVMSAESTGIRALSDGIKAMPVASPDSSAIGLLKEAFTDSPENAVKMLLQLARPSLRSAGLEGKLLKGGN